MSAKTQITADFATPKDVASRLRVSATRAAELRRGVLQLVRHADGSIKFVELKVPRGTSSRKNGKTIPTVRVARSKKK